MAAATLFEKLWQRHVVHEPEAGPPLLYMDRHLVYEVTSPQAFEGLRMGKRRLWRPQTVLATADHNVPTTSRSVGIIDPLSRIQFEQPSRNCKDFGVPEFSSDKRRVG